MPLNPRQSAIAALREGRQLTRKQAEALGYVVEEPCGSPWEIRLNNGHFSTAHKRLADCLAVASVDARIRFRREVNEAESAALKARSFRARLTRNMRVRRTMKSGRVETGRLLGGDPHPSMDDVLVQVDGPSGAKKWWPIAALEIIEEPQP